MKTISVCGLAATTMWMLHGSLLLAPGPIAFAQSQGAMAPSVGSASRSLTTEQWVYVGVGVVALVGAIVGGVIWFKREQKRKRAEEERRLEQERIRQQQQVARQPQSAAALELELERREHQLTKKLHELCSPTHMMNSGADHVAVAAMVARHREILERPLGAAIVGAAPPSREWKDVRKICLQLANFGLADDARSLLSRPDVDALLPRDPSLMSGFAGEGGKINSGSRSLECALVWCEVASASQHSASDVQQARAWFKRAVAWLPNQQDIEVLLQWAHFERSARDMQSAAEVVRLLGEARTRVEQLPNLSPEDRVRVWLESADNEMDRAGIPRLEAAASGVAHAAPFSSTLGAGSQGAGAAIDQCKQYLEKADDAIQRFPRYYQQEFGGSAEVARYAPLHFRVQCAYARMHLGANRHLAEQSLLQALGEHAPCSSLQFVRSGAGSGARVALQSDWSRLEVAGTELSASDRQLAQTLRVRWVEFCIEEAEAAPSFDALGRQSRWRDAAWLLCRYWASTDSARLTGEVLNTDRLAELSRRVVGRSLGMASLGTQPSGWDPESFEDRAVSAELQRRIRQDPPPPPPPPTQSNLICRALFKTVAGRQVTTPVVEEVRVYDAAPAAPDYSGFMISVDPGGGVPLRRQGVFGYALRTDSNHALGNPVIVDAGEALGSAGKVAGSIHELARMTFDGIAPFGPGFDVVVRKRDGGEYKRLRVEGVVVEGEGQLPTVDIKSIVNGRLNIQVVVAALSIEESPVHAGGNHRLLRPLMTFFEQELGEALPMIQEQLREPGSSGSLGLGVPPEFFGEELMTALAEDFSRTWRAQPSSQSLSMPKVAVSQLGAPLAQALARLVDKFEKVHPEHKLCAAVVAELGLGRVPPRPMQDQLANGGVGFRPATPQPVQAPRTPDSVPGELRARYGELLSQLGELGIVSNAWGMARDRMAIRSTVREMHSRVQSALSTANVGGAQHQRLQALLFKAEALSADLGY